MKPYAANGGKPTFVEFITPIGLFVHMYHDKPQLKTSDQLGKVPELDENGIQRAEFKVTLAWEKTRQGELADLVSKAMQVRNEAWPESNAPGAFFHLQPFFRDGDNPEHNTKGRDYLRGCFYLNFKSRAEPTRLPDGRVQYGGAPGLLGPNGPGHVLMPTDVYAGCTGRVSGIMFGTEYMGKHYISTRLNNIQKYQDGDRIGGGQKPSADSQFDALIPQVQGGAGLPNIL